MPSRDSDSFVRVEIKFPLPVLTFEKSDQNPDGTMQTADGFSSKQFYYNMNDEEDENGDLVLRQLWPAYVSPVDKNKDIAVILEEIHCDRLVSNLD